MTRFLIYYSYIGTTYNGSQRQLLPNKAINWRTVQGALDLVLRRVWLNQPSKTTASSRTDAGVHAIEATSHFDFVPWDNTEILSPETVTRSMNRVLNEDVEHTYLRILNTRVVPDTFHSRHNAKKRSYVFRLAVLNHETDFSHCKPGRFESLLPIAERCRCHVIGSRFGKPFDVEAFMRTIELFNGEYDFATFMASPVHVSPNTRTVQSLETHVTSGRPFMDPSYDPLYRNLDFYDVHFSAKSFLYKQIRRIVGTAIGVAVSIIPITEAKFMLDHPSQSNWNVRLLLASSNGLYLRKIHYDENGTSCSKRTQPLEIEWLPRASGENVKLLGRIFVVQVIYETRFRKNKIKLI